MPLVALFGVIGTLLVLLWSVPGRALTSRTATAWISRQVAGHVELGLIGGNLFDHLSIDGLRITDSLGAELIHTSHLDMHYALSDLIAGRLVFSSVTLDSAVIHLIRLKRNVWNYEAIFRPKVATAGGGASPLVELHNLVLHDASVRVDMPTAPHAPREPVSRHGAEPDQPRLEQTSDTLVRVYTFEHVNAEVKRLRISTPDRLPILADVTSLATEIGDPRIHLTDFQGTLLTAGDSLRFTLDHADMPNTQVRGAGAVRWPEGPMEFDFTLDADRVDLKDLQWVSPDFPDWHGSGHLVAYSPSATRTDYRLDHLTLGDGRASAVGKLVAIVDNSRGLGMGGLDLMLKAAPLEVMRPYLDTIPFAGTLTGHLKANGFLDTLRLGGDLHFADALVEGAPLSHLVIDGVVHFGGKVGAVFDDFRLMQSDVALATVHRVTPSMLLPGTMHLDGHLNGPWENADFLGTAEHHAPNGAVSRLIGAVRLDVRDTSLGITLDANFDQLSFDALRTAYPNITARGGLVGHVQASGTLAALDIDANVTGDIGTVMAKGRIAAESPRFSADSLTLAIERFDLAALMGSGESSSLNGRILVTGTIDSLTPPNGRAELHLDRSRVGGITFSSATAQLSAANGIVTFDTATVTWPDGSLAARGTLGWAAPDSGTLSVEGHATALGSLDSLVRATLGFARDTLHPNRFNGTATAKFEVRGSRDRMSLAGTLDAHSLVLDDWRIKMVHATLSADSLGAKGLAMNAFIDSLSHGAQLADSIQLLASGRTDSLVLSGGGHMNDVTVAGAGSWVTHPADHVLNLRRLAVDFPRQQWRLTAPARFTVTDQATTLADTVQFQARDGSGLITLFGAIPGAGEGNLGASIVGLSMADVYGLLQRDTTVLSGLASLDFRLGGSREAPTLRGNASLTGAVSGDVHAPLIHAAFDYVDRRLRSNVTFWTTGAPILEVDASLPLDLALTARENRRIAGPLSITAQADSIDLLVLEALLPSVRNSRGSMRLNFMASGSWDAPKLQGDLALRDAAMTVPALGVRYDAINGKARFTGDSLLVDSLRLNSGGGSLMVNGDVRFTNLSRATLDLRLDSRDFLAMDSPNFLRLRPTGDVTLTGPLLQPVLRSANGAPVLVTGSVLYFADLITKNSLDTQDPLLRDLVDTLTIRRRGLGPDFQNRFLDSLRIENLTFNLGSDDWLRSSEANIQLEGQVRVDKLRKQYQLAGTLNAPRGTYTLRIAGIFPRVFNVESGTVQYSREPDLNASLNIRASHHVRTNEGDDILISAAITGSIAVPKVELSSPGRNLTNNQIVSYLAVGRPDLQLGSGDVGTQGVAVLSRELQRSILALGLPLDVLEFSLPTGLGSSSLAQFSAGKQLGDKWFVMVNAGLCVGAGTSSLSQRNFGASLEYRMTNQFRLQASAAPVQSCGGNRTADVFSTLTRYQLGVDLLWSREY